MERSSDPRRTRRKYVPGGAAKVTTARATRGLGNGKPNSKTRISNATNQIEFLLYHHSRLLCTPGGGGQKAAVLSLAGPANQDVLDAGT